MSKTNKYLMAVSEIKIRGDHYLNIELSEFSNSNLDTERRPGKCLSFVAY